jgi:capsular exopolysaccharide synthesis family protein
LSKNYELLQISGKGQRLFAPVLEVPTAPAGEFAGTAPNSGTPATPQRREAASSNRTGRAFPRPPWISGGRGLLEDAEEREGVEPASWSERLAGLWGRSKIALASVIGNRTAQQFGRSRRNLKALTELASIAREEQVKLVQRVFLAGQPTPKVVVFSGIEGGNGCSRVCAESAMVLAAQTSASVCLVDSDLRSPTLHRYFGLDNREGFAEAMLELGPIRDFSRRLADGNLWIMTSGVHTPDPHALLTSETLRTRLKELREAFDFVLLDAPPLNPYADATKLGSLADGVILVMGANSTRREAARKAKEDLKAANAKILAAVLNRRTFPIPEPLYKIL